jgi:hypothetical protein
MTDITVKYNCGDFLNFRSNRFLFDSPRVDVGSLREEFGFPRPEIGSVREDIGTLRVKAQANDRTGNVSSYFIVPSCLPCFCHYILFLRVWIYV